MITDPTIAKLKAAVIVTESFGKSGIKEVSIALSTQVVIMKAQVEILERLAAIEKRPGRQISPLT